MKIAHVGDAHLGKKQYGLNQRRLDYRKALSDAFDIAYAAAVAVIILPGDILNSSNTSDGDDIHFLQNLVAQAKMRGVVVVGIEGNHDVADGKWLSICGILNLEHISHVAQGIEIVGVGPQHVPDYYEAVAARIKRAPNANILVTHQTFAELTTFQGTKHTQILTCEQLAETLTGSQVKYVAAGDIHTAASHKVDGILMAYAGSTDITASNENPMKRILILDTDTWATEQQFLTVREHVPMEIANKADLDSLIDIHRDNPDALFLLEVDQDMEAGKSQTRRIVKDNAMLATISNLPRKKIVLDGEAVEIETWDSELHSQSIALGLIQKDTGLDKDVSAILTKIISTRGEGTTHALDAFYKGVKV